MSCCILSLEYGRIWENTSNPFIFCSFAFMLRWVTAVMVPRFYSGQAKVLADNFLTPCFWPSTTRIHKAPQGSQIVTAFSITMSWNILVNWCDKPLSLRARTLAHVQCQLPKAQSEWSWSQENRFHENLWSFFLSCALLDCLQLDFKCLPGCSKVADPHLSPAIRTTSNPISEKNFTTLRSPEQRNSLQPANLKMCKQLQGLSRNLEHTNELVKTAKICKGMIRNKMVHWWYIYIYCTYFLTYCI